MNNKVYLALALAMIAVFLFTQIPKTCSAQQAQANTAKAELVMSNLIGLDLTKYKVQLTNYFSDNPYVYGGMLRERMMFTLHSTQVQLGVICTFVNSTLAFYDLYPINGSFAPIYTQPKPNNLLDVTKDAIQRYQAYSGSPNAQDARNSLDRITGSTLANVTLGNTKLNVITMESSINVNWLKNINNADYPTGLSVRFDHEILIDFSDLSSFYTIGNPNIAISRDKAISMAQKEAFSNNQLNITLADGSSQQVTLQLPSQPSIVQLTTAWRQPLTWYPLWQVQFYSDKPIGDTNGYQVGIWADTGEIQYSHLTSVHGVINDTGNAGVDSSSNQNSKSAYSDLNLILIASGIAAITIMSLTLLLITKKRKK